MAGPRIAYFIDELRLGGATRQLAVLARALAGRADPVVFCLSPYEEPLGPELRGFGVPVHTFRRRIRWDPAYVASIARRLRSERVDLVHGWLVASDAYAWLTARSLELPVVFALQNEVIGLRGLRRSVFVGMMRRADAVTVNSRAGYGLLVDTLRLPRERVLLLPNWVGADITPSGEPAHPPVIANIGRLVAHKRNDALIDAFALLRRRGVDARLEIAGDGPEMATLKSRAEQSGFGDDITFHGMLADVRPVLGRAACVVLPSDFEGLPNTAVEAFMAGVPVVATPVGDLGELVREGRTGRLIEGNSPEVVADGIAAVLGDAALRQAARTAGPELVRERFSIDPALDALTRLYGGLVSRSS